MKPTFTLVRPSILIVPAMLAAPLALLASASAAPCDEYAKSQRVVSAGAVGGTPSTSSQSRRAIAVRVENGKVSVEVDGQSIPESRLRRDGDSVTILDASGAPMSGVPPIGVMDGSGSITIRSGGASSGDIDVDAVVSEVMVGARELAETWGPRIKAEIERAIAEASRAAESAGRAAGESGAATELFRRLALTMPRGEGATASVTLGGPPPKVMLGVTLAEPEEALVRHLSLKPGETTLLAEVRPDLPAAKAGLETFDVVVAINGGTPADPATVRGSLAQRNPGDSIKFTVRRGSETKEFDVLLAPFDGTMLDAATLRGVPLDADAAVQPLLEMLRGQIRLAPMQNGEGDFFFEVEEPAGGVWQGRSSAGASGHAGATSEAGSSSSAGNSAGASSGSSAPSGSLSAPSSAPNLTPNSAPTPGPRVRGRAAAPDAGTTQRLEAIEQRLDEVSRRLERMLEKLEKSGR